MSVEGVTTARRAWPAWGWYGLVGLAALVGLGLLADSLVRSSATYDEVTYLEIAAEWWRTGDEDGITHQGSPLLFWKLQQAPVLWFLDRTGRGAWIENPIGHQAALLPLVRGWSLTIWLAALLLTAAWARQLHGPRAMALAAGLFAFSPNLLAHGALVTMELPVVAFTTGMSLCFWRFLRDRRRGWLVGSAMLGGLAWSCKYTTVVFLPIFAALWFAADWQEGRRGLVRVLGRVAVGMTLFGAMLGASNVVATGLAFTPLSPNTGQHGSVDRMLPAAVGPLASRALELPVPRELTGFVNQMRLQGMGGSSYLLGERRDRGWWYYYFVALAVKMPLTFGVLLVARAALRRRIPDAGLGWTLPLGIGLFLAIAAAGSTRNYGIRYLLPAAPLAIVWVSGLGEGGRLARALALIGLIGQAGAVLACHPHELVYFNRLAGGPIGGRRILADSNLDWGQGAKALARLQAERPEFRDLTLYYFGETDPRYYGVAGKVYRINAVELPTDLPCELRASTPFVAVSASLQWGPWGPAGYFRRLDPVRPLAMTEDTTIAIYRTADLLTPTRVARQP